VRPVFEPLVHRAMPTIGRPVFELLVRPHRPYGQPAGVQTVSTPAIPTGSRPVFELLVRPHRLYGQPAGVRTVI